MPPSIAFQWRERLILTIMYGVPLALWAAGWVLFEPVANSKTIMFGVFCFAALAITRYAQKRSLAEKSSVDSFFTRHQWWLISLLFLFYFFTMSRAAMARHQAFQSHAFDLGIFDQAIWSTLHGKFLFSSYKNGICLLGDHMSPILVLFAPLYWIWNDAQVLLVAQALISALCFFPLALIAQEKLGKGLAPVVFVTALFFYQPLRHSIRSDFHPELLANLFLFAAFYALMKSREKLFFLLLLLSVLCKENMYGIAFAFGIYFLLQKRLKLGLALLASSIILFLGVTQILMPKLAGSEHYFYQANYNYFLTGRWGSHPPLIASPLECFEYLYKIYLPLGGLSFFHLPTLFLTAPILFQNILSRNPLMHSIAFQYTSGLTPMVFISAVYGLSGLLERVPNTEKRQRRKLIFLAAILLLSFALTGKSEGAHMAKFRAQDRRRQKDIQALFRTIDSRKSLVVNENLAPHLSHRFLIYPFEDFQRKPKSETYAFGSDLVLIERGSTVGDISEEVKKIKNSGYQTVYDHEGIYLFVRRGLESVSAA